MGELVKEVVVGAIRGALTGAAFGGIGVLLLKGLQNFAILAPYLQNIEPAMPEEVSTEGAEALTDGVTIIGTSMFNS
ncbi:MAG TPA: hypothetical protein VFI55_07500 [Mycobacterium sp.]|nr:hypothetical protein [Mycobacterium sp.]